MEEIEVGVEVTEEIIGGTTETIEDNIIETDPGMIEGTGMVEEGKGIEEITEIIIGGATIVMTDSDLTFVYY